MGTHLSKGGYMAKIEEDAKGLKEDLNARDEEQGLSRRSFIKSTSALTAAAVVLPPLFKPSVAQAAADSPSKNQALRAKLEQAHRILSMEGLAEDSTRGHVTVRSEDGLFYIKPHGTAFEWVKADQMQGLDIDGNLVEGKGRVHGEKYLHLEVYRARKDVKSVIHLHPMYSTILSTVFTGSIVIVGQQSVPFTGKIPLYTDPSLVNTKEKGVALAKIMGNSQVLIMQNHGITVAGQTIEEALVLAIHLEHAARDHIIATQSGKPIEMNLEDAKTLYKNNYSPEACEMMWGYFVEKFKNKS
jgi:ribulose-5-phosphate 4-epimerase/fuculose-1-phosphate aldolase